MSAARWDAIVIGASVDGLTAAHYLARAGRRVLVVEADRDVTAPRQTGWVPPPLAAELRLAARGLQIDAPDPWIVAPLPAGGRLELRRDLAKSVDAIRRISPADAAKWPDFASRMHRLAGTLQRLYLRPPPDVRTTSLGELLRLAGLGLHVRRLGRDAVVDLARILPMSIAELLDDWFESDALKGVLGALGVWHLRQGPRSGGTAFNFLHHHVGSPVGVFRPARSNVRDVLLTLPGIEVRRGERAAVVVDGRGRATGVRLEPSGAIVDATMVVSSLDPKVTFAPLESYLDPAFALALRHIKGRTVAARGTLTPGSRVVVAPLCVAPSLDYLERGYDDAKYGRTSANPYVESWGTDGRVVLHVQYAPAPAPTPAPAPDPGLAARVAALLDVGPDQVRLDPVAGRHLYHGELTLDQILFMRPVPGWSRYRTPLHGLYLCGPGTHPGGGIAGAAGRNAARTILEDS